ncbi:O-antigen ligase family protein [Phaeodactylibacter luteus]|uniref:O-antigen ligase family protein n=1 Tax=Phaeodactylibacter luteus TaxID=1564516 RepID=A0A5C6RVR0_9BACT|nr:O-antigen ligase family protein [Phaeodactylibacter luteus]TXB66293.1 O-antigen ligase family protein [Phaeodactylibacter luteus]
MGKGKSIAKRTGRWAALSQEQQFFAAYAGLMLTALFAGIAGEWYFLAGVPAVLLIGYLAIVDLKAVFTLLLFCIPISTELQLPSGLGLDLPTEPLMVGLMFVGFLFALQQGKTLDGGFLRHPITLLILLHLGWIAITAILSHQVVVSFKFLLSKIWYLATFFFLASRMLRSPADIRRFHWAVLLPLVLTIAIVTVRHGLRGFAFSEIHWVLSPFYRNHVAYAAIAVLFLPFVWFVRQWYPKGSAGRWAATLALPVLLVAIQLSYTRAAYVAAMAAVGAYYIIRLKLTRHVLITAVIGAAVGLGYVVQNNRYLDLAPNYETTVSHKDFNNLIQATYELEDISTMERLYRWVAGFNMTAAEPILGFGPGNFYFFYKSYTVTSFTTYVSDNPEKSGIHNYYLMLLVEQGIPGLLIFLALCFYALLRGEAIYHDAADRHDRHIAMMAALCIIIILVMQLINDLLETDKVGPFFFMSLAMLVVLDRKHSLRQGSAAGPLPREKP